MQPSEIQNKALFLDRDGVINADTGHTHKIEDIHYISGIFDFCRSAIEKNYIIIIITNQSGIARGLYGKPEFHDFMRHMAMRFKEEGCPLTAYYFCPHHPDFGNARYRQRCDCRKPKPGMILQAAKEWKIDLAQSLLVGDKESDIEAGKAAGVGRLELFAGTFPSI